MCESRLTAMLYPLHLTHPDGRSHLIRPGLQLANKALVSAAYTALVRKVAGHIDTSRKKVDGREFLFSLNNDY